jgi:hypothetical protein
MNVITSVVGCDRALILHSLYDDYNDLVLLYMVSFTALIAGVLPHQLRQLKN